MKRLFIAEKPSLAKAIFEGLGGSPLIKMNNGCYTIGDDKITSCYGHMLQLFDPHEYDEKYKEWRLEDLPIKSIFPPSLKPKAESEQRLNIILKLLSECDQVVNAGDYDDRGCLIINEILTYANNTKPVKRLLITDLNLKPVQKALNNLKPNEDFQGSSDSALAQSIGDQLFGYNLTRTYTLQGQKQGFSGVLNVGRVTSNLLNLVNLRTIANENHQDSFFYEVIGNFKTNKGIFSAKYLPTENDVIDEKNRIISIDSATSIKGGCDVFNVSSVVTKQEKKAAPLPYNLSSLQQTCAKKWGFSATYTLEIIQKLYDNLYLTYPRSDCRYLSEEHFDNRESIIDALKITLPDFVESINNTDLSIKHKAFNTDKITAHHAICPTEKKEEPNFTVDEKRIYELVVSSFLALFYPNSIRDKTRLNIVSNSNEFIETQSVLVSKGWEILFTSEKEINTNDLDISKLKENEVLEVVDININEKKTSPPKYFVESTLLAAMSRAAKYIDDPELRKALEAKDKDNSSESGSIGTEATRAGLLLNLSQNENLVTLVDEKGYKEKIWKTTKQGQDFCKALPKEILAPDTSALWSQRQELIRQGKMSVPEFLALLDEYINTQVNNVIEKGISITPNMENCPICKSGFIGQRKGEKGVFWGCSNHPECTALYPDNNGKPNLSIKPKRKPVISKHKCPMCAHGLIRRSNKVANKTRYFWGCSNFPDCTESFKDKKGLPNF